MKLKTILIILAVVAVVAGLIWYANQRKKRTVVPGMKVVQDLKPGESVNATSTDSDGEIVADDPYLIKTKNA